MDPQRYDVVVVGGRRQVSVPRSCWAGREVAGSGVEIVEDRVTGIERGSANSSSWRGGYLARTSLAKE